MADRRRLYCQLGYTRIMAAEIYAGRYHIFGNSKAVILPVPVREALMLKPDDLMLMSVYGSYLIMRRVTKKDLVDFDAIPTAALPARPINQVKNAG